VTAPRLSHGPPLLFSHAFSPLLSPHRKVTSNPCTGISVAVPPLACNLGDLRHASSYCPQALESSPLSLTPQFPSFFSFFASVSPLILEQNNAPFCSQDAFVERSRLVFFFQYGPGHLFDHVLPSPPIHKVTTCLVYWTGSLSLQFGLLSGERRRADLPFFSIYIISPLSPQALLGVECPPLCSHEW